MTDAGKTLEIRTSPHILSGHSVDTIMFNVVLALLPVTAFAVYAFGLSALLVLGVAVASCLVTEWGPAASGVARPLWETGRWRSRACSTG